MKERGKNRRKRKDKNRCTKKGREAKSIDGGRTSPNRKPN